MVRERVKKESFTLIPSFVDDKIAEKITGGLSRYFEEVEENKTHTLRKEITKKLFELSSEIKENPKYEEELNAIKTIS